jgi:hypothetical protein
MESVLLIFSVVCIVLLFVSRFLVPCCDVHYNVRIKTKYCSPLPRDVCRWVHILVLFHCVCCALWCQAHIDCMSNVAVYYKRQKLLTIHEHMNSPPFVLCAVILCVLTIWVPFFILRTLCYQFLSIVHFWLLLRCSLAVIYCFKTPVSSTLAVNMTSVILQTLTQIVFTGMGLMLDFYYCKLNDRKFIRYYMTSSTFT